MRGRCAAHVCLRAAMLIMGAERHQMIGTHATLQGQRHRELIRVRVRHLDGGRGTFRGKGGGFFGMFLSDKAVSMGIQGHHELLRGSLREPHLEDGGLPPRGIEQDYVRV